jgi:hypothetical protein
LNASPAGGARIISTVKLHFTKYGPSGVPNGLVEVQNEVKGKTPCLYSSNGLARLPEYTPQFTTNLPHSLSIRDCPISTAKRFPKALMQIRKFNAEAALPVPNTFSKKTPAATTFDSRISSLLAALKYAIFASTYRTAVKPNDSGALHFKVLTGF